MSSDDEMDSERCLDVAGSGFPGRCVRVFRTRCLDSNYSSLASHIELALKGDGCEADVVGGWIGQRKLISVQWRGETMGNANEVGRWLAGNGCNCA